MADQIEAAASLKDAESLFLRGQIDDAAALCDAVLQTYPNEPGAIRIKGLVALIKTDFADALALLEKVAAHFPDDFMIHVGLAESKWGVQRQKEAATHLRRAVQLEPTKLHLRARLGLMLLTTQDYEPARQEMETLLASDPNHVDGLANLGIALINLHRAGEAVDRLRLAAQLDQTGHAAPFNLGQALREVGLIDDAIEALREAVRRNPDLVHLRIALGDALWGRGLQSEGHDELKRATELDPSSMLAWAKLGDAEQQFTNMQESIACYRKAMALFTGDYETSPFRMLSNVLFAEGEEAEAEQVMADGLRSSFWYRNQPRERVNGEPRIATLCALGRSNTPTDYIINPRLKAESICMLERFDYPVDHMDRCFDVIFNSASDPDSAPRAIELAAQLASRLNVPIVNPPSAMAATMRHHTPERLAGIAGLHVPATRRLTRQELLDSPDRSLAGLMFPVLLRPTGSHGGAGLVRVESQASLLATLSAMPDESVYVTEYYDFSSADGLYRKLRVIFVDGQPFPFHLSINDHWLNHYYRTRTAQEEMLRSEEAMFLQRPETYLGKTAYAALQQVATRHPLGFFGMDGAMDRDGKLVVFECNATMLVRHRDQPSTHDHKKAPAEAIRAAVTALLAKTARNFS